MGRPETVSDEEILGYILSHADPIVSTSDIADHFGFYNSGMNKRLYKLDDAGYVDRKKVGGTNVWWLTAAGEDKLDAAEE